MELSAIVHTDPPVSFSLVDESGQPVTGANLHRELERYVANNLPADVVLHGLHPTRPEFLSFYHENRNLIGTVSATWTESKVRVIMRPAATLIGRMPNANDGANGSRFMVRVTGDGIFPDTVVGGRVFQTTDKPGERHGEFRLVAPPLVELRGDFVQNTGSFPENKAQPILKAAFGPLTPQPGETIDFGELKLPE